MFTRETLIEMISLQHKLNCAMAGNAWLHSDNSTRPYYRAAWVEGGEAVSHYGYKWWKKFDRLENIGQVKLEVVDQLHFVLSDELRSVAHQYLPGGALAVFAPENGIELDENGNLTDGAVNRIIGLTADKIIQQGIIDLPDESAGAEETFILVTEQFVAQTILRRSAKIKHWGAMADAINLTMTEAGLWYIGKVALNFLRDNNGQKEGNYVKSWWGKEDNAYLELWIKALLSGDVSQMNVFDATTEYLTEQYRRLMVGEAPMEIQL